MSPGRSGRQKKFKHKRQKSNKLPIAIGLLIVITVVVVLIYMFVITLLVYIIPSFFWSLVAELWLYMITHFNPGEWVLTVGVFMFIIILINYFGFVLWNHGVYSVLKRVKRIEEEEEIEQEIRRDQLKEMEEEELKEFYEKQTGKRAVYRGKETKGYQAWKKKYLG